MVAFTRILAGLSLLPAIQALALPGDVDGNNASINNPPPDKIPAEVPEKPLWACDPAWVLYGYLYILYGKDWNMTEHQVHQAVKATPACVLTGWKWHATLDPAHPIADGEGRHWDFKAEFSFPLGCTHKFSKTMNKLLGLHPDKARGIDGFRC